MTKGFTNCVKCGASDFKIMKVKKTERRFRVCKYCGSKTPAPSLCKSIPKTYSSDSWYNNVISDISADIKLF